MIFWKKYSFYSIDEILNTNQIQIYENMCFPKVNHEEIPNRYKDYQKFLKSNWSFDDFREGPQQEAINALIDNSKDLLLRLPTGGGKSIVFHLPALLRTSYTNRLAVVITPLRALMDDQVKGLWSKGFYESVDFISGGRETWLNQAAYEGILDGRIKLIFVAPERFRISRFTDLLERRRRLDHEPVFVLMRHV